VLHLIHPALVHFPLVFLVVGGVCQAAGLLADRPGATRFGTILVLAGTVAVIPTIASGYLAANSLRLGASARADLGLHELGGWVILAWFTGCVFWQAWSRGRLGGASRYLLAVALLVGVVLTAGVAFKGGELVYVHGAGVAAVPGEAAGVSSAEGPP
jgi:uncharacterized membrane protein